MPDGPFHAQAAVRKSEGAHTVVSTARLRATTITAAMTLIKKKQADTALQLGSQWLKQSNDDIPKRPLPRLSVRPRRAAFTQAGSGVHV